MTLHSFITYYFNIFIGRKKSRKKASNKIEMSQRSIQSMKYERRMSKIPRNGERERVRREGRE